MECRNFTDAEIHAEHSARTSSVCDLAALRDSDRRFSEYGVIRRAPEPSRPQLRFTLLPTE